MFQFQINIKKAIPIFIIIMSSLCAFFITDYVTQLQLDISNVSNIPMSYQVLFKMSSSFAALIPIVIFGFLYFTTQMMANEIFGFQITDETLFFILGIAFAPMMLYYYFYWANLIYYCGQHQLSSLEDFLNTTYIFQLSYKDFEFINLVCWAMIYLIVIIYFIYKEKPLWQTLLTVLLPSSILILAYKFIF